MPSLYKKKTGIRDPGKIIIAVEGHKREKQYFDWFGDQKSRIQIAILEPEEVYDPDGNKTDDAGRVKPAEVLGRLKTFCENAENDVQKFDHVWMVMDGDKFKGEHEIHNLAQELSELNLIAAQKHLAISIPCFELWLLLHVADPPKGRIWNNCQELKAHLPTIKAGGFDSTRDITTERVKNAIERAKSIDAPGTSIVPNNPGTKIHELAQVLIGIIG